MKDIDLQKSIFIINKSDLGNNENKNLDQFNPISISIKEETNIDKLIDRIKENLKNKFVRFEDTLITRERHRQHLQRYFIWKI